MPGHYSNAPKPVIFLAFANPKNDLGRLAEEHKQIRAVLASAEEANLCQLVERFNIDIETVFDVFQRKEYRNRIAIFHYGGHAGDYTLLLQKSAIDSKPLDDFFARQESLQLVFLNGCSTQKQAENLLEKKIPTVIATSQAIDDKLATEFSIRFYSGFAQGLSIEQCFADAGDLILSAKTGAGASRHLHGSPDEEMAEAFSWKLYKNTDEAIKWNLPGVANDPYFGLPPLPQTYLPNEPFLGLKPYTPAEAHIFFGRGDAIRNLYLRLTDAESEPIVLFYGQSGAGKSSLLDAGLLPRLSTIQDVRYARRDKALGLTGTMQQLLQAEKPSPAVLLQHWKSEEEKSQKALTIILDQAEEVFARFTHFPAELEDFISLLGYIFASPLSSPKGKLVLGYRKEYHAEMEAICLKHHIPFSSFFLEPLNRKNALEVITGITFTERTRRKYNLGIEEGLAEDIAGDLTVDTSSPIAPVLQILMIKMWKEACTINKSNPRFTHALYNQLRMQGTGLSDFLDQQLAAIKLWNKGAGESGLALDLLYFHTTSLGTADSQTLSAIKTQYTHQGDFILELVSTFKDRYLLTDTYINQEAGTRLAHDTLAPLIRARFDASLLPGQKAFRVLKNREADWQVSQQDNHLSERELENVENGASGMRAWSAHEQSLISVSRTHRNRARRARKILWATFGILVIGVFISAGVAWILREKANQQATIAHAQQLAAQARVLADQPKQLQTAALLAMESVNTYPNIEGDQVMRYLLEKMLQPLFAVSHQSRHKEARKVSFSPDSKYLLSASDGEDILLIITDVTTGKSLARLETNRKNNELRLQSLSATGTGPVSRLAFSGNKNAAFLHISQVQFSPDAQLVCFNTSTGLWVWKWQTADSPRVIRYTEAENQISPTFTIDALSAYAAITTHGQSLVKVIDLHTAKEVQKYALPAGGRVSDITFSPADPLLAVLSTEGTSILWDLTDKTGKPYATFKLQKKGLQSEFEWNQEKIEFDASGEKLLTIEEDGSAAIWDVKSKAPVPLTEVGHDMSGITFNQSGNSLASMNTDGTISVWQADTGAELFWQRMKGKVTRLFFCKDDKYVAALSDEDDVKLYDSQSGVLVAQVPNDAEVYDLAASPDSRLLATADANGMARVWEIHTDGTVANLLHTEEVEQLMLSGNGQRLISKSRDGFAHIWDPATGRELYAWQDLGLYELTANQDASRLYYTYIDSLSGRIALRAHDRLTKKTAYTLSYASDYLFQFTPAVGIPQRVEIFAEVKPPPAGYLNILSQSFQEKAPLVYLDSTALPSSVVKSVHIFPSLDHLRNTDTLMAGSYFLEGPVAVSADGRTVAAIAENNIYLWDAHTGRNIAHLPHGYEVTPTYTGNAEADIFTDMAVPVYCQFSGDNRYLVSLTNTNVLRIWDIGQKQYTLPILLRQEINLALPHLRASHTYASLPADNPYLLVIEDTNRVALMDFPSLAPKHTLTTRGKFEFFSFGADNHLLATVSFSKLNSNEEIAGNADSFIEIWNTSTGERLRLITINDPVHYTAFSPDGQHLVTAGRNGQARVWNLETGMEVSRIVHQGAVQKAFFAADGKILVTTTGPTGKNALEPHSMEIKLSYWQKTDLLETLSSKLIRNLSEVEWEQYFPDANYRKTIEKLP